MTVTLMSWNIWDFNQTPIEAERQAGVLAHIRRVAPDVLCIQEFCDDGDTPRLAELCADLQMDGLLALSTSSRYHTAVLWRDPVTEVGPRVFYDEGFWHAMGATTLSLGSGAPVRIGSVHLTPFDRETRVEDAKSIAWLGDSGVPTVIAGDWNCIGEHPSYDPEPANDPPADRETSALLTAAGLTDAAQHLGAKWQPTCDNDRRIDAFRLTAAALARVESYEVDQTAGTLSDHLPILLRIT
ncbi:endonuclease/exonuclease/phosphatase family protein [Luteipulveratus mongoliensis]|uniref:Endonuclease/exonuclease/phosphatase domain-containing protein n=1 Tax=Luteipulveratus mongoliensis TaxID=571913 RepID=A0A0K1JK67_9MICO|nr:endonuclease/exonuclease/phosphatase family protein [Luteipulveratus mongoliensis]AKU17119.1 hypothetical protein VV02_16720 [Luteipulveratus mongoliensis]